MEVTLRPLTAPRHWAVNLNSGHRRGGRIYHVNDSTQKKQKAITVTVNGKMTAEQHKTWTVTISAPIDRVNINSPAEGTILNNETTVPNHDSTVMGSSTTCRQSDRDPFHLRRYVQRRLPSCTTSNAGWIQARTPTIRRYVVIQRGVSKWHPCRRRPDSMRVESESDTGTE
jgi:hypothetical protein